MADDYIELYLEWTPGANQDAVRRWLEQHNLSSTKMKSGLLLLGTRTAVENAFSVSLDDVEPPVELPIPTVLKGHVASITFPKPRSYHT
jgi:hypothetical protein